MDDRAILALLPRLCPTLFEKHRDQYDRKVRECVEASLATDLPLLPPNPAEEEELERIGGIWALPMVTLSQEADD